jgi:hypothetical protein
MEGIFDLFGRFLGHSRRALGRRFSWAVRLLTCQRVSFDVGHGTGLSMGDLTVRFLATVCGLVGHSLRMVL